MESDAQHGPGPSSRRHDRLDALYDSIFQGTEKELTPLFDLGKPEAYTGRGGDVEYHQSTAGGALSGHQPAGAAETRALRLFQYRLEDLTRVIKQHGYVPLQKHY
eukprot:5886827-Pyramimonas_sp.AAC.1